MVAAHGGGLYYSGIYGQAELDPEGSNVGTANPNGTGGAGGGQPDLSQSPGGWGYGSFGDPFGSYSCRVNGFDAPCSLAFRMLSNGSADIDSLHTSDSTLRELNIFAQPVYSYRDTNRPHGPEDPDKIVIYKDIERYLSGYTYWIPGIDNLPALGNVVWDSFKNSDDPKPPPSPCNLKVGINNNNLNPTQLDIMKSEIERIYNGAGISVGFVNTYADYYLLIMAHGDDFKAPPSAIGATPAVGNYVTNTGKVFVDRLIDHENNETISRILFNASSEKNLAIGLGRAGAHEIAHHLLQLFHSTGGDVGFMSKSFKGTQWFGQSSETLSLWNITAQQEEILRARLCPTPLPDFRRTIYKSPNL